MPHKYRHRILQNNGRNQHQNPMSLRTHHTCAAQCDQRILVSSCDLVGNEDRERDVVVESEQHRNASTLQDIPGNRNQFVR